VAVYPVASLTADQETAREAGPATAVTALGAVGGTDVANGITELEGADQAESVPLLALVSKVYAVPLLRPVTTQERAGAAAVNLSLAAEKRLKVQVFDVSPGAATRAV
jgi:hypothetical protein